MLKLFGFLAGLFILFSFGSNRLFRVKNNNDTEIRVTKDIIYGTAKTQNGSQQILTLDFYQPTKDRYVKRPLIIFAHGGYFLYGDKSEFSRDASFLVSLGYAVASINYRLIDVELSDSASKKAVIDAVHDMKAAVRFFKKDALTNAEYRIDSQRIVIGGYSAGAVTSLHYAYANTREDGFQMGGKWLLKYILKNGGLEGNSGNPSYSSSVKGVLNFAGSLHSAKMVDANEPFIISVHGTADEVVPFNTGTTGETNVVTEGSGLIHLEADKVKLTNLLIRIEGGDHLVRFTCSACWLQIRDFLSRHV